MSITLAGVNYLGRSRAACLPADVRLPEGVKKVQVRARSVDRITSPVGHTWDEFFSSGPRASDDFVAITWLAERHRKGWRSAFEELLGHYRRACGVPDGTDFDSFRRNVSTSLEAAGVGQVAIARFVGQKVGTMAGDVYSAGGSRANSIATSRKVRYGARVERGVAKTIDPGA